MYLKRCEVVSRPEYFSGDVQETIKKHSTIKRWAYILHDKDDTAPHYHIYLSFGNSGVDSKLIAEWFGLQESQVSKCRSKKETDLLLYLIHANDSQKNKHQYDVSEVVSNFDFETEIKNSKIIGDFEHFSYAQQLRYVNTLPVSEKPAVMRQLKTLWELECKCLALDPDRKIEVVFICGKGGVGKTFYAKRLLDSLGYDYSISSASNDPFQDYAGQKGIILDDLRDKTFPRFEDFLKILDNNNNSSVASRFNNKVFNGKMIVITSAVPLKKWFRTRSELSSEDFNQLYRRISCYVTITKKLIRVFSGVSELGDPCGDCSEFKNDLILDMEKEKKSVTDFHSVFAQICSPVEAGEQEKIL